MSDLRRSRWMAIVMKGRKEEAAGTSAISRSQMSKRMWFMVVSRTRNYTRRWSFITLCTLRRNAKKRVLFTFDTPARSAQWALQSHSVAQDSLDRSNSASLETLASSKRLHYRHLKNLCAFAQRWPLFGVSVCLSL
jgi:hypothetical protein